MKDDAPTEKARVTLLVAHPDDETLWAGGTLLIHDSWQVWIGTLCRGGDAERAPKFRRALDRYGATGMMADLDDGPGQVALLADQVKKTLLSLLPPEPSDLVITHAPNGEYTRHLRHEEVSRGVLRMWACGELRSRELWLFAYEDDTGRCLPRAARDPDILKELSNEVWEMKRNLLTEIYGFGPESWEVRTTPRREAFWRLVARDDARAWLERGRLEV